jgi:hypothetical protein
MLSGKIWAKLSTPNGKIVLIGRPEYGGMVSLPIGCKYLASIALKSMSRQTSNWQQKTTKIERCQLQAQWEVNRLRYNYHVERETLSARSGLEMEDFMATLLYLCGADFKTLNEQIKREPSAAGKTLG